MKVYHLAKAVFLVAALSLCAAIPAFAGDAAATTYQIHIQEAVQSAILLVFGALSAVASWLVTRVLGLLATKFKLQIHNEVTAAVDSAVQEGLRWAQNLALEKAAKIDDPKIRSEVIANAANYVLARFPKILTDAKIDTASLRELITSHLPVSTTETDQAEAASGSVNAG